MLACLVQLIDDLGQGFLSSLCLRCFIYEKKIVVVIIIAISKGLCEEMHYIQVFAKVICFIQMNADFLIKITKKYTAEVSFISTLLAIALRHLVKGCGDILFVL